MNDVMVDLETFGTTPGSVIRSIGAVVFDPYSDDMGTEFYVNIQDESCVSAGLTKDQSTIDWWKRQSPKAIQSLLKDPVSLTEALVNFNAWFYKSKGMFVWSQGGNFDESLLAAALRAVDMVQPWKFWDSRCTRTAYSMAGFNTKVIKRAGTYHNALDDAKHQARCVQGAYAKIGRK